MGDNNTMQIVRDLDRLPADLDDPAYRTALAAATAQAARVQQKTVLGSLGSSTGLARRGEVGQGGGRGRRGVAFDTGGGYDGRGAGGEQVGNKLRRSFLRRVAEKFGCLQPRPHRRLAIEFEDKPLGHSFF